MKSKASLLLMEQLIMILVFALAAVLCLQVFVSADQISRDTARQDRAVLLAQNGAEAVKASSGDLEKASSILGAACSGDVLSLNRDELRVEIHLLPASVPGLGQAEVAVLAGEEQVFSLVTAWQEVGK